VAEDHESEQPGDGQGAGSGVVTLAITLIKAVIEDMDARIAALEAPMQPAAVAE
jgi:hypothetical protein